MSWCFHVQRLVSSTTFPCIYYTEQVDSSTIQPISCNIFSCYPKVHLSPSSLWGRQCCTLRIPRCHSWVMDTYSSQFCNSKWRFVAHCDKTKAQEVFGHGKQRYVQVWRKHLQEQGTDETVTAGASEHEVCRTSARFFTQVLSSNQ